MQGKSKSLRLGLLALVVVLIMGALGSLSLARDAFDGDYDDCRQSTRLDAVSGLAVERTDEEDEIRISWDALQRSDLSALGPNVLKARITVIVEGGGIDDDRHVALGDTDLVVDRVEFTKDLTVSVALTLADHVISDIAETDFTSGMPAPSFSTDIVANVDADGGDGPGTVLASDGTDYGDFYYLGFNDLFDNWYSTDAEVVSRPTSARFRVGLQHGSGDVKPGDADFENYRITIEDGNGDLLGYQAQTVSSSAIYRSNVIIFGANGTPIQTSDIPDNTDGIAVTAAAPMTSLTLSNQVKGGPLGAYYGEVGRFTHALPGGLAYANLLTAVAGSNLVPEDTTVTPSIPEVPAVDTIPALAVLYAIPPVEYFDFPRDIFEGDGELRHQGLGRE